MIRTLLFVLFLSVAHAAPLVQDLGQGLSYYRAHALPADLPSTASLQNHPSVLDLRYATGDSAAATALSAWLKFHAAPKTPVFVLANNSTSSDLLTVLANREHTAGLIVLGAASDGFVPDIALSTSPEAERKAYDALEHGAAIDALINPAIDKPRDDEAKLARERQSDAAGREDSAPAPAVPPVTANPTIPATPPPPIDLVLQRAVHVHRALLALKKL